jgi:IMP dehydrogenase
MNRVRKGYTFDDLLLVPQHSKVVTRSQVDLSVNLGKDIQLGIPIVSANMKNVTGLKMAQAISGMGGLAIIHRFANTNERLDAVRQVSHYKQCDNVAFSVGVGGEELNVMHELVRLGAKALCVDVAHGDHENCIEMVREIRAAYPDVMIIAGNVATAGGAKRLNEAGADVIKVGVGPGSLCTTRVETGNGVPQMSALEEVYNVSFDYGDPKEIAQRLANTVSPNANFDHMKALTNTMLHSLRDSEKRKFKIIADGGIRRAGDIVKALCFADAVMLGSILAGTDEAPGTVVQVDGMPVKAYEGSSTHKTSHVEGVKAYVPLKGPVSPIIQSLLEGVRSGCSYQGVDNLVDLKDNPEFVEISNAGLAESHPHSVTRRDAK